MPLQVIGAGFGRTGTMTLKHALEELGNGPCYHMIELTNEPQRAQLWLQAAKGKTVNWNQIFDGFSSTADFPGCLFYQDLLKAYPKAKVILTVRDAESWYRSASQTIFKSYPSFRQALYIASHYLFKKRVRQLMQVGWLIQKTIFQQTFRLQAFNKQKAIAAYQKHNAEVQKIVPPEQLLVYEVKDGWAPLCKFLDVPIPESPFPNTNKVAHFHKMKELTLKEQISESMKRG
jgi:hypothetical protein